MSMALCAWFLVTGVAGNYPDHSAGYLRRSDRCAHGDLRRADAVDGLERAARRSAGNAYQGMAPAEAAAQVELRAQRAQGGKRGIVQVHGGFVAGRGGDDRAARQSADPGGKACASRGVSMGVESRGGQHMTVVGIEGDQVVAAQPR